MRFFKILLTVIIGFSLSQCAYNKTNNKDLGIAKEELLQTVDSFNEAFRAGNLVALESMITENYLHTNGNSKTIGKRDWLNYLSKRENEIKSGNLEVIEYKMDDVEIEFYNNVAIVTGKIVVSNKEKGEILNNAYRITNVWVNESGNWKRAGFHDGKIE